MWKLFFILHSTYNPVGTCIYVSMYACVCIYIYIYIYIFFWIVVNSNTWSWKLYHSLNFSYTSKTEFFIKLDSKSKQSAYQTKIFKFLLFYIAYYLNINLACIRNKYINEAKNNWLKFQLFDVYEAKTHITYIT